MTNERKIKIVLNRLFKEDKNLLELDVNERTLSGRIALYLHDFYARPFTVDCEYNRDASDPKRLFSIDFVNKLNSLKPDAADENGVTVYPDIIVHERGTPNNLLVIEIKKESNRAANSHEIDHLKLEYYLKDDGLGYDEGYFIVLKTGLISECPFKVETCMKGTSRFTNVPLIWEEVSLNGYTGYQITNL